MFGGETKLSWVDLEVSLFFW